MVMKMGTDKYQTKKKKLYRFPTGMFLQLYDVETGNVLTVMQGTETK